MTPRPPPREHKHKPEPENEPEPGHVHLFHSGVAAAGKAAREGDPPRSFLVGCAVCGQSVQLGLDQTLPRVPWKGPTIPWPALQPGFRRP